MEIKNSVITVIRHKDRKVVANNVLTVIKEYTGKDTDTIRLHVNNLNGEISAELTDLAKMSLNNAINKKLSVYEDCGKLTANEKKNAYIYVDKNGSPTKVSMQEIKLMNTKIVSTNTENESPQNLETGDFLLSKI